MKEVKIGANNFQIRKLPAYPDQLLLAKAIMPIQADVLPLISRLLSDKDTIEAIKQKKMPPAVAVELMETIFSGFQKMSNDDLMNLTQRALIAVQVQQGNATWQNVMLPDGQLMFQNLELSDILQLIWNVVEVNLFGFFADTLGTSQGAGTGTA